MLIRLDWQEVYYAATVGIKRWMQSRRTGKTDRYGGGSVSREEMLFYDVMGAIGELAAAKGIGIYWPAFVGVGKESPDLLPDIQVRTICEVHKRLIVREGDSPVHRYVLAVMEGPNEIRLRGWIRGDEAFVVGKLEAPNNRTPAHFVPNEKLYPISTLDVNNEPATTLPDLSPAAQAQQRGQRTLLGFAAHDE